MDPKTHRSRRAAGGLYTLLVFAALLLVLIVVVLSAWLRLAGSGLGCAEWPSCYALIRTLETGTEALAAAHLVPPWATLTHRLVASLLGALVLGIALMAWRRRREPGHSLPLALALLALTLLLSVLGYKTPSPLWPWVTLGNLLGGMAMLALLWWLGQRSILMNRISEPTPPEGIGARVARHGSPPSPLAGEGMGMRGDPPHPLPSPGGRGEVGEHLHFGGDGVRARERPDTMQGARGQTLRPWALIGVVTVFLQIALGGWVSANFAALACADVLGCGGYPWHEGPWRESFNLLRVLPVTDGGAVIAGDTGKIIHLVHRAGALLAFIYIVWLGGRAVRLGNGYRATGIAMLVLLALQMLLGIFTLAFGLPLSVVTAHNAVAALLLLSVVNLYHLSTSTNKSL